MISLISIIDKLLTFLDRWVALQKEKKAQKEYDELEANPADWFDNHFSGLSDESDKTEPTKTNISDKKT